MTKQLSVSFILCSWGKNPVGGFRIIYEYANRLSKRNWKVNIIHPARIRPESELPFWKKIRRVIGFYKNWLFGSYLPKKWYKISPRVKMIWVPDLREKYIPKADYVIACPVDSVDFVNSYNSDKGKKYYFIQHFEDWIFSGQKVEEIWKLPLKKIVISRWLQKKAETLGEKAIYIPNGLDFSCFDIDIPFNQRPIKSVLFMCHFLAIKGTDVAIKAFQELKKYHNDLKIHAFGVIDRQPSIPDYIIYHKDPPQKKLKELYNSCRFFLSPSLSEGWGLPACEAMMCGCAVLATDIPGHREFIIDGENGFFCCPGDPSAIVEKFSFLFKNPSIVEAVGLRARESLKKFDWDSRVTFFEQALLS